MEEQECSNCGEWFLGECVECSLVESMAYLDTVGESCGVNADWIDHAWHFGPSGGLPNRVGGDYYIVANEDSDGEFSVIRRFYVGDAGYDGDGYNDDLCEIISGRDVRALVRAVKAVVAAAGGNSGT